jgi:glycosyltransferase involved in cell wall biosynthesis
LITAFSAFGFLYQRRRSAARSSSEMTAIHLWAGERFCRLILESHPSALSDLYCFNSAGLELLSDWRARGRRGVVEQTIAPRRVEERLLREEEDAFPGWEAPRPRDAYVEAYMAREEAEWQAAHTIVCGSDFVKAGVAECGGPVERCVVVPYGVPLERFRPSPKPPLSGRKLRVLMVGEVGLRKGSHYVFAAAQRLADQIDFRLVGPISLLPRRVERVGDRVQLTGVVPRGEIIPHFDWADVFLLPSLCEGSATVTYEALSAGLPVIATPNTGSIVEHGKSGFIVPPRDMDALVAALERFLIEPGLLTRMRTAACERSHVGSLAAYGQRLMVVLAS